MFSFENKDLRIAEELRSSIELSTSDYDKEKIRESLANHSRGVVVLKVCFNVPIFRIGKLNWRDFAEKANFCLELSK
ncbi:hypothetical protein Tco_1565995 [Tanacetum coccineum]